MRLPVIGAFAGLSWAVTLRAYMAEIAGPGSHVDGFGTFVLILLPGVLVGAALGWAEHLRRTGGRRGWRWLAVSPLIFSVAALAPPGALETLLTTGIGGGAVALPLIGMLGGYAISGRGPIWARIVTGAITAAGLVGTVASVPIVNPALRLTDARGVWVTLLIECLIVILIAACSIPHRKTGPTAATPAAPTAATETATE
jgi:hypothetical protein